MERGPRGARVEATGVALPCRTLLVDDEEDMLLLLRTYLSTFGDDIEVVGEATDGDEALAVWRATQPDVIVMDNRMPGRTGLEVAAQILGEDQQQGIILFTAIVDADIVDRATEIGVRGVVGKDRFRELPDVIRQCHA